MSVYIGKNSFNEHKQKIPSAKEAPCNSLAFLSIHEIMAHLTIAVFLIQ